MRVSIEEQFKLPIYNALTMGRVYVHYVGYIHIKEN